MCVLGPSPLDGRSPGAPAVDYVRTFGGDPAGRTLACRHRYGHARWSGERVRTARGRTPVRARTVRPTRRDDRSRAVLAVPSRPRVRRVLSPPPLTARATGLRPSGVTGLPCALGRDRPVPPCPGAPPMRKILALTLAAALALAGCSRAAEAPSAPPAATSPAAELRLGYFPNITHAPALIGVANGFFTQELGSTKLTTQTFNAGGDEVAALLGGSLDAGFIGSSPAINALRQVQRRGRAGDRGLHVRRRPARRAPGHHLARAAQGQDHRDAAEGQHAGRRAEEVAEGATTSSRVRARTRSPSRTWTTPARSTCSRPTSSRAAGCRSRGAPGSSTRARRCSSTRRRCGRTGSSPRPC